MDSLSDECVGRRPNGKAQRLDGDPKLQPNSWNGYGRFPQFGMYTGRTEYHGWYAEPHTVEENGVETTAWEVSKKLKRTKNYIAQFENLRQRPDAWEQLKNRNKIPSIGGRPEIAPDDDELALAFDELSPVAQRTRSQTTSPTTT